MTFLGLKRKVVFILVNHVFVGTKRFECKRRLLNWAGFDIGKGTKVVGPLYCSADLRTGVNCWVGKNLIINGNGKVIIGDNCDIAPEVAFQTGGHEIGTMERRAGKGIKYDIFVGNGCWIGARSTLLGGVNIKEGCVIAACSCVNKNIEKNTLVAGVPAKLVRKLENS